MPKDHKDNPWKQAIDYQLNLLELTVDNFDTPEEALSALLDWYVITATDSKVNKSLPPVAYCQEKDVYWWEQGGTVEVCKRPHPGYNTPLTNTLDVPETGPEGF